jgi:hypothetical protein
MLPQRAQKQNKTGAQSVFRPSMVAALMKTDREIIIIDHDEHRIAV